MGYVRTLNSLFFSSFFFFIIGDGMLVPGMYRWRVVQFLIRFIHQVFFWLVQRADDVAGICEHFMEK